MSDTSMKANDSLEALVGQVADDFLRRQEAGARPDVEEYVTRHPEAAELLRKVLASLKVLELSHPLAKDGSAPRELGDFRLLRIGGPDRQRTRRSAGGFSGLGAGCTGNARGALAAHRYASRRP
jgi:hypothetical protein